MKGALFSINKPHTGNIVSGRKEWELRKRKPNIPVPFPGFVYETKKKGGCGKVIGEFICDRIIENYKYLVTPKGLELSCLTEEEANQYLGACGGYGLHISNFKVYDKPKEISEFRKLGKDDFCGNCNHIVAPPNREPLSDCDMYCDKYNSDLVYCDWFLRSNECYKNECFLTRPPQSWCYIEVEE